MNEKKRIITAALQWLREDSQSSFEMFDLKKEKKKKPKKMRRFTVFNPSLPQKIRLVILKRRSEEQEGNFRFNQHKVRMGETSLDRKQEDVQPEKVERDESKRSTKDNLLPD